MGILNWACSRQLLTVYIILSLLVSMQVRAETRQAPLDCVLEPSEVVEVSSAVEGVIERIHVDRNDMVKQGQLLVELDDEVETTQVELAAARAALHTNIDLMETELAFHKRNEERLKQLYDTDTISLHIKDEAETDTRKSLLQLKNAREAQELARLELAKAQAILELRSMHSPIEGVIVARHKVAGEFVEDQSILRIAKLDPLVVEVIVPGDRYGSIKEDMLVEVVPEHNGKAALMARVTMVDRVIDPSSGTFDVRAELENPDYAIPSGLHCTAQFSDKTYAEAMAEAAGEQVALTGESTATESADHTLPDEPNDAAPVVEDFAAEDTSETVVGAVAEPMTVAAVSEEASTGTGTSPAVEVLEAKECAAAPVRYSVTAAADDNSLSLDEMQARLLEAGYYDVVRLQGSRGARLALGVFSNEDAASQVQEKAAATGIEAKVKEMHSNEPVRCDDELSYAAVSNLH